MQVNVTEGGSVFYCPWSLSQSDCHTIEFDTEGKHYELYGKWSPNYIFYSPATRLEDESFTSAFLT